MTFISWKNVPDIVAQTLPHAVAAKKAYLEQAKERIQFAGEVVTWQPGSDCIRVYSTETRQPARFDKYAFEFVPMTREPDLVAEILIKRAALPVVGPVFDFAHKALGGPRPLSNAIVASLMAGGLGYGAGTLIEQLFPERYLRRGKLRRTLGLTGVGAGALLGLNNAYANAEHTGQNLLGGLLTRNDSMPDYPEPPDVVKKAFMTNSGLDAAMYQPSISVPQFNNAAWRDVNMGFQRGSPMHTPPAYAAATTGLMSGLSAGMNSPIIRPMDVVRGIASAGVGLATATVAGKALSAMAGLTPAGQQKLQDMGMWGGMMRAIVPSMFGVR